MFNMSAVIDRHKSTLSEAFSSRNVSNFIMWIYSCKWSLPMVAMPRGSHCHHCPQCWHCTVHVILNAGHWLYIIIKSHTYWCDSEWMVGRGMKQKLFLQWTLTAKEQNMQLQTLQTNAGDWYATKPHQDQHTEDGLKGHYRETLNQFRQSTYSWRTLVLFFSGNGLITRRENDSFLSILATAVQ